MSETTPYQKLKGKNTLRRECRWFCYDFGTDVPVQRGENFSRVKVIYFAGRRRWISV
jgi:hypothetical protein